MENAIEFSKLLAQMAVGVGRYGVTFDIGDIQEGCDEGTMILRSDCEQYEVVLKTADDLWTVYFRSAARTDSGHHVLQLTYRGGEYEGWEGVSNVIEEIGKFDEEVT